jgi:ferredoxin-like protein FixX
MSMSTKKQKEEEPEVEGVTVSALQRIRALQAKAAMKQAAVDACDGHIWGKIYVSKIDYGKGSFAACIRCGERRAWTDIGPNEQWEYDTSLPTSSPSGDPKTLSKN